MTKWLKYSAIFAVGSVTMLAAYQNCGSKSFESQDAQLVQTLPEEELPNGIEPCEFNGLEVLHGHEVTAYQNSSVDYGQSCKSEKRICNNGSLSGSYNFASCEVGGPKACLFEGVTVPHGQSIQAFQNAQPPKGASCVSEDRVCDNGALSGSYKFANCEATPFKSCSFDGKTVPHKESVNAYVVSTVPFGQECVRVKRICDDGNLSGVGEFASCSVNVPKACRFDGRDVAHGEKVKAFKSSSEPFGGTCSMEERVCNNGELSGDYTFASCAVDQPRSCMLNGETIAHGQSVRRFFSASVAFGGQCQLEDRVCMNGNLTGSATQMNCNVAPGASCTDGNGHTFAHGWQGTLYTDRHRDWNQTCEQVAKTRSCYNGVLSGSAKAIYLNCDVKAPKDCTLPNGNILKHGKAKTLARNCTDKQSRTCTNGDLSGSDSYSHMKCTMKKSNGSADVWYSTTGSGGCSVGQSFTGDGSGGGTCHSGGGSTTSCVCD